MRILAICCVSALLSCSERRSENPAPLETSGVSGPTMQDTRDDDSQRCVSDWQQVDDGIRYRNTGCRDDGLELHVVEIDPKLWSIDAVDGPRRRMSEAVAASRARFAVNANFFDVNDRSLGLIVSGGKTLRPAHPVSWQSIFSIDRDGRARITRRAGWDRTPSSVVTAVQAGPSLVVNGSRNRVAKAEPSFRSGVCITVEGRTRFFVTARGRVADVHEMVEVAARSELQDGMGCRDAMLFDGGPSAQMHLSDSDVSIEGDRVPTFVIARPRRPR